MQVLQRTYFLFYSITLPPLPTLYYITQSVSTSKKVETFPLQPDLLIRDHLIIPVDYCSSTFFILQSMQQNIHDETTKGSRFIIPNTEKVHAFYDS